MNDLVDGPDVLDESDPDLGRLIDELTARLQAHEPLDIEAFLAAHAEHAEPLRRLIPTLRMMADVGQTVTRDRSLASRAEPEAGLDSGLLGDYQILREMGRGGMGVVYEARQVSLGRRVALKVLPFVAAVDSRRLQRFRLEAQAAALLHHTHIVPVFSIGCERGVHYYAMQFIEGHSLAELIRELREMDVGRVEKSDGKEAGGRAPTFAGSPIPSAGPDVAPPTGSEPKTVVYSSEPPMPGALPLGPATPSSGHSKQASAWLAGSGAGVRSRSFAQTVAELGIQAADALDHAHQQGVLHRDIKPANLMVDAQGQLWITDFGLARFSGDSSLTLTGDIVGTLRYMSPEQALAKRAVVDQRTDICSLGVTLYELVTLHPAVSGDGRHEMLRHILVEEPCPPRHWNPAVPADLETILLKAIAKEPRDRYATAQEFGDDLRRFLENRPVRARRPTLMERAAKWARPHRGLVAAAALGLLLAAVGLGVSLLVATRAYRAEAAERGQAEENLRMARRAVDDMYTQVAQRWLAQEPQMTPLQREFLVKALGFYQQFAKLGGTSPADRHNTAVAYLRVGEIHRGLGQPRDAEAATIQALPLLKGLVAEFPDNPSFRNDLAHVHRAIGVVWLSTPRRKEAERHWREALLLREGLVADFPNRPEYRRDLASLLNGLGSLLITNGRLEEATRNYERARQLIQGLIDQYPREREYRFSLARVQTNLANLLAERGQREESMQVSRENLEVLERLVKDFPENVQYRQTLASNYGNFGGVLRSAGKPEEAKKVFEKSLTLQQRLASDFPQVPGYRLELAGLYNNMRTLSASAGDIDEAQKSLEAAAKIQESLVAGEPSTTGYRQDLALTYYNTGTILLGANRRADAERFFRRAIEHYKQLVAVLPDRPELRQYLARCHNNLGVAMAETGRLAEAESEYKTALELKRALVQEVPGRPEFQQDLAMSYVTLGFLFDKTARPRDAEKAWNQARELYAKLAEAHPTQAEYRKMRDILQKDPRALEAEEEQAGKD
jgi:tetratricopeptide (TPR) repeat protein